MPEKDQQRDTRAPSIRHRGRDSQIIVYLGKQLRFFINESDWKVLPMAAIIAALVGLVIRRRFFINMEGSLIGAFALTCTAIWNGCFNSIQSVCRECPIVKREHRAGMHISAYVAAHMIYQLALCAAQTALSLYVLRLMGVRFPEEGFMTRWMIVDIGVTMLLISYAADMLSLLISSVSRTTTGAMTVMPFVLIFQLVFSGGIIPLPGWSKTLSNFTISNYGIRALAAQSGYNELPMITAWNTLAGMKNTEVGGTFTVGEILDLLDSPAVESHREDEVIRSFTVGEAAELAGSLADGLRLEDSAVIPALTAEDLLSLILTDDAFADARNTEIASADETGAVITLADALNAFMAREETRAALNAQETPQITLDQALSALPLEAWAEANREERFNEPVTLGDIVDFMQENAWLQARREETVTVKTTIGELFDLFGEDSIRTLVQEKTAAASWNAEYERSVANIVKNWIMLGVFILLYALLAVISLELIDRDKR